MIKYILTPQFCRFLGVGGTAALLNWLARLVLSRWLSFEWAVPLAYAVGVAAAFVLNRIFVFPNSVRPIPEQLRNFVLVNVCVFPMVWAFAIAIDFALRWAGMKQYSEELAHAISIAIPMVATFLLYKFFAFKDVGQEHSPHRP